MTSFQVGGIGFAAVSILCESIVFNLSVVTNLYRVAGHTVGPHQWNVRVSTFTPDVIRVTRSLSTTSKVISDNSSQLFIVADVIYSPTILMAKLSLLWLYLEVFGPNPKIRYSIYLGILFVTLFYTGTFIAFCVLAIPRPGQSLLSIILSKGVALAMPLSIIQGAVNVASDFYIFILPIPGVLQSQFPLKWKIGICATFAAGSL